MHTCGIKRWICCLKNNVSRRTEKPTGIVLWHVYAYMYVYVCVCVHSLRPSSCDLCTRTSVVCAYMYACMYSLRLLITHFRYDVQGTEREHAYRYTFRFHREKHASSHVKLEWNTKEKCRKNNHDVVVSEGRWQASREHRLVSCKCVVHAFLLCLWPHRCHSSLLSSHLLNRLLQVWLRRAMHRSECQKKDLIHFRLGWSL